MIIALWGLSHFAPKRTVVTGEEKVSLDQDKITTPQESSTPKPTIRAAIIGATLARLIESPTSVPIPTLLQKRKKIWWAQGLTNQFLDRTTPQETGNSWETRGDWKRENHRTKQNTTSSNFHEKAETAPTSIPTLNVNNKEAAAAAAVAIARASEESRSS